MFLRRDEDIPPRACEGSQRWPGVFRHPAGEQTRPEEFPATCRVRNWWPGRCPAILLGRTPRIFPGCSAKQNKSNTSTSTYEHVLRFEIFVRVVISPQYLSFEEVRVQCEDHKDGGAIVETAGSRMQWSSCKSSSRMRRSS